MKHKRQLTTVARLRVGDQVKLDHDFVTVERITGTPGRNPADGVRKKRLYVKDSPGYVLLSPERVVEARTGR